MTDRYVREVKLRREKVSSFDAYPFSLPVVRHLEALDLHPAVTFLVGENGSGKSTLLEALAVEEPSPAPPIINSYGYRSLHEQSHGESFFAIMMHRFGGHGFYVLDERHSEGADPLHQDALKTRHPPPPINPAQRSPPTHAPKPGCS
jgi:predicted ATPase